MELDEQIRRSVRRLAEEVGPVQTIIGKVKSVDEDECTCVIIETVGDDELEIPDVRLKPVLDSNEAVIQFPKVDSYALILRLEADEDWMLVSANEIDKFRITIGTQEFEMDGTKFSVKKGSESLKKIFDDTLEGIEQLTVNTNVGPSSVPINLATFAAIKVRVDNFLK